MFGELLGAGVSLLGGLMGSKAEKDANKMNYQINAENLAWAKEQFKLLLAEAQRQEKEGKLGYRDAQGNWVHYVEGKGWTVDLDPQQMMMRNLYRKEDEKNIVQNAALARERMFADVGRQRDESTRAAGLLEAMNQNELGRPQDTTSNQRLLAEEGINEGYDASMENALRMAKATGSSNDAAMLAQSGRARGDDLRKAFLSMPNASDENYNRFATRGGNLAQEYNQMAGRASAKPGTSFQPEDIGGATDQLMQRASAGGGAANQNLLSAMQQGIGIQNNYKAQPAYGMANTLATLGNQLGTIDFSGLGGGSSYRGSGSYSAAPTRGADYYKSNAGLW